MYLEPGNKTELVMTRNNKNMYFTIIKYVSKLILLEHMWVGLRGFIVVELDQLIIYRRYF